MRGTYELASFKRGANRPEEIRNVSRHPYNFFLSKIMFKTFPKKRVMSKLMANTTLQYVDANLVQYIIYFILR